MPENKRQMQFLIANPTRMEACGERSRAIPPALTQEGRESATADDRGTSPLLPNPARVAVRVFLVGARYIVPGKLAWLDVAPSLRACGLRESLRQHGRLWTQRACVAPEGATHKTCHSRAEGERVQRDGFLGGRSETCPEHGRGSSDLMRRRTAPYLCAASLVYPECGGEGQQALPAAEIQV